MVDLELLVVPGCPNEGPAVALSRSAQTEAGLSDQGFRITVIADERAAARHGFTGSPTFLIDRSDPFDTHDQPTGLTCRLYRQSTGRLAGLPDLHELRDALAAEAPTRHGGAR